MSYNIGELVYRCKIDGSKKLLQIIGDEAKIVNLDRFTEDRKEKPILLNGKPYNKKRGKDEK